MYKKVLAYPRQRKYMEIIRRKMMLKSNFVKLPFVADRHYTSIPLQSGKLWLCPFRNNWR